MPVMRCLPSSLLQLFLLACGGLATAVLPAQAQPPAGPRLQAVRTSSAVVLDGVLDEPAWNLAPVATGFTQREPSAGQPATEDRKAHV